MAETSITIGKKIQYLLDKVDIKDSLLTFGFVKNFRDKMNIGIPEGIINYCLLYAFLKMNEWYKGREGYWKINETKLKASLIKTLWDESKCTIYADPLISKGKYEWKMKLIEIDAAVSYIGVASNMTAINGHFYGAKGAVPMSGGYSYAYTEYDKYGRRMSHKMSGSVVWPNEYEIGLKPGDIFTVHLDLDEKTVGWSKNDKFIGNAFENIEDASYRLVISVPADCDSIFEFVE